MSFKLDQLNYKYIKEYEKILEGEYKTGRISIEPLKGENTTGRIQSC